MLVHASKKKYFGGITMPRKQYFNMKWVSKSYRELNVILGEKLEQSGF